MAWRKNQAKGTGIERSFRPGEGFLSAETLTRWPTLSPSSHLSQQAEHDPSAQSTVIHAERIRPDAPSDSSVFHRFIRHSELDAERLDFAPAALRSSDH
jgi:hypothetical protein